MQVNMIDIAIKILVPVVIASITAIAGIMVQTHEQQVMIDEHQKRLDKHGEYLEKYVIEFIQLKEKVREKHE